MAGRASNKGHNATNDAAHIAREERKVKALQMRKQRWTYQRIANELGVSVKAAWDYVSESMTELKEILQAEASVVRELELESLDELEASIFRMATGYKDADKGDKKGKVHKPSLYHLDRVIKIKRRRAALLGLDAMELPDQAGASDHGLSVYELAQLTEHPGEFLANYQRALQAKYGSDRIPDVVGHGARPT